MGDDGNVKRGGFVGLLEEEEENESKDEGETRDKNILLGDGFNRFCHYAIQVSFVALTCNNYGRCYGTKDISVKAFIVKVIMAIFRHSKKKK